MKDIQVDRDRLIKVLAMAGLVLLGLSILPGLLKTPKAPELPPDVGFMPSEAALRTSLPSPVDRDSRRSGRAGADRRTAGKEKDELKRDKSRKLLHQNAKRPSKNRREPPDQKPDRPDSSGGTASPTPAPAPPSAPVPAPAPAPPPPAPAPAPPPPQPPGDGSQEFAPH